MRFCCIVVGVNAQNEFFPSSDERFKMLKALFQKVNLAIHHVQLHKIVLSGSPKLSTLAKMRLVVWNPLAVLSTKTDNTHHDSSLYMASFLLHFVTLGSGPSILR